LHPDKVTLALIDWLVVAAYFVIIFTVAVCLIRKHETAEGYFLAGRRMTWPFIGASIFAANISAEHFVGLAGGGYQHGLAVGGFEWMGIYVLVISLAGIFLPFYLRARLYTIPEFLERRYSSGLRIYLAVLVVVLSVLAWVAVSLYASARLLNVVTGWDKSTIVWSIAILTALYTMKGGLKVVIYTDFIQVIVMVLAAITLTLLGLRAIGGVSGLTHHLDRASFSMIRPATDPDYPWPGMIIGLFFAGSFYWAMNQVIVQRALAAKDIDQGQKGAVFAGFLKILPVFILVTPGLIAKVMYPALKTPDDAYPTLVRDLMPIGLRGLTIAGLCAALMGHLSATYNSLATIVARDLYLKLRPDASQENQVSMGRFTIAAVAVLGALCAPLPTKFDTLWDYVQFVNLFMMVPMVCAFFLGIFWRRANAAAALASVIFGTLAAVVFAIDEKVHRILPGFFQAGIAKPWMNRVIIQLVVCAVIMVVVTLLTKAPKEEKVSGLIAGWPAAGAEGASATAGAGWWRGYAPWGLLVMLITTALWYALR
jgi:SSS family solute:Na+ symporter